MRVAPRADVGVVVLKVNPARTRDLVVDRSAEAFGDRPAERPSEDGGGSHRWLLSRTRRHMVVELLRGLQPHAVRQLLPERQEAAVHQHAVPRPARWLATGAPGRSEWLIPARGSYSPARPIGAVERERDPWS